MILHLECDKLAKLFERKFKENLLPCCLNFITISGRLITISYTGVILISIKRCSMYCLPTIMIYLRFHDITTPYLQISFYLTCNPALFWKTVYKVIHFFLTSLHLLSHHLVVFSFSDIFFYPNQFTRGSFLSAVWLNHSLHQMYLCTR